MNLWKHQTDALKLARDCQRTRTSRVLIQLPPGTGKTEIASRRAIEWIHEAPFNRVIIAAPTTPIMQQYYRRLVQLTSLPISIEKAQSFARIHHKIILASQSTLWQRIRRYPTDSLFIMDECHHSNYNAPENLNLIKRFDHVMGMSATPWSSGCYELFSNSGLFFFSLQQAQTCGLVAPYELSSWVNPMGPWALVFCASNEEAKQRSAAHPGSAWIGVQIASADIAKHVLAWKTKRVQVLYVNRMLLEGFDEPRCAAVWIARDCESAIMRVQMAGRALRFLPGKAARIYTASEQMADGVRNSLERLNVRPFEGE